MANIIALSLRGLEFLWTLLIMALTGNMIADAFNGNPSEVNYTIFVSVFSMLSLIFLIAATFKPMGSNLIQAGLDGLNALLALCGGIAMAAALKVHSCGNEKYILSNRITNGSHNPSKRCHEAQAVTAFLWFLFACYAASAVLSMFSSGSSSSSPGIRRGPAPVMSHA